MIPAILGLAGPALSDAERGFFRDADPAGYILFKRNCVDRAQVAALTASLRDLVGRDVPILIDQEGGRVQRMGPPAWPKLPAQAAFADLYRIAPVTAMEAARLNAQAIGVMLREVGVTVDCLPLLDVPRADGDAIIGDRALGRDPMQVASLGRLVLDGLRDGGVIGVAKHMPGHGRATADSHLGLPTVVADAGELEHDIAPFRALADVALIAMTAHIVYAAWDAERCASLSPVVIGDVIRGAIGFGGLLLSDDIGMHALAGGFGARAGGVVAAGCDLALHCSGDMAEMIAVADALSPIGEAARARLDRVVAETANLSCREPFSDLIARRDVLLAVAA